MLAMVVAVVVAIPFLRCWNYGIIDLDDYQYLTLYRPVREWLGWESIVHAFTNVEESIWMPLTWFSYCADWAMFGDWFGGFHLHSIAVHCVNTLLVWWLLRLVFAPYAEERRETPLGLLAFLGALVWAVHPLRCESVVFVASRKDVLSFFWELLALICWVKGTQHRQTRYTVWSMVFFVLGSMCKPSVMTFPVLCLLLDAFAFREIRIFRYVVPLLFMLFLGAFAHWQQAIGGATVDYFRQPLWGRLLGACAAFGIYLRNFVWPQWLAPQCIKTWPVWPRFWLPGLVISGLWGWFLLKRALAYWDDRAEIVQVAARKWSVPTALTGTFKADYLFLGAAWFAIAVAPMLGIASFGYHSYADRFTYIPAIGLSILVVLGLAKAWEKFGRVAAVLPVSLAIVAFAACTWWQTGFWEDDYKLFTHTLEVDGDHNACAHGILACWYFEFPHDLENCCREFKITSNQDYQFVYPCFWIYVIALGELGRESEIAEQFRRFEAEAEKIHGPERMRAIWAGDPDLSPLEITTRGLYYACKVSWYLADNESLNSAKGILDRMRGKALEADTLWLFLRWKYNKAIGNQEETDRLYRELYKASRVMGYNRFRYLFKDPANIPTDNSPRDML